MESSIQLSEGHLKEINKFLQFFKSLLNESLKELQMDHKDFVTDSLTETIYNREDVKDDL